MGLRKLGFIGRNFWLIFLVTFTTTTVAIFGVQLFGQKYDAMTAVQPTTEAIQQTVNSANSAQGEAVVTDDSRWSELRRIAGELRMTNVVGGAVYGLANTPSIISALGEGVTKAASGGTTPEYDQVTSLVRAGIQRMSPEQLRTLKIQTGLPSGLWPDFVYLYAKLRANDVPMDFLSPEKLAETVRNVAENMDTEAWDAHDVIVTVRAPNPRKAEILASAITAWYKYGYDQTNNRVAQKNLQFYTAQLRKDQASFHRAAMALASVQELHGTSMARRLAEIEATYRMNEAAAYLASAERKYETARDALQEADAGGTLHVLSWAGTGPSSPDHPEAPAEAGAKKARVYTVLMSAVFGLLGSMTVAWLFEEARRKAPTYLEKDAAEPPVIVVGGRGDESEF